MSLRVLFDQNVPYPSSVFLRERCPGWLVRHVADVGLWGATDAQILSWATADQSIVIEDFADARMFPVGSHYGVIRLRVWPTTIEKTNEALQRVLNEISEENLPGSLIIVDDTRIRIRRAIRHG
jgi:predicted nuclease of predicted toxin-antitoxin system